MNVDLIKKFQKLLINFAKEECLTPDEFVSNCQAALLEIAGQCCRAMGYTDDEYEQFMREYASEVQRSIDEKFRKE